MALQITKDNEEFKIVGKLQTSNAENFYNHFKHILSIDKSLCVNIDSISEIDRSGVDALIRLHGLAKDVDSNFFIVGRGCKDIYDEIRMLKMSIG